MAIFYFGAGFKWLKWFELNSFISDINKTVQKSGESTRYAISEQTRNIIASEASLIRNFQEAFDKTDGTLKEGFGIIGREIHELGYGIESLGAAFSYGMSLITQQLEVQTQILSSMLEKLDSIHKTLENPTLTQAREFYNMGRERLQRGFLDKALEAFLRAEKKNDTDFLTQYSLGYLYLYGRNEDCNVVNLCKAKDHFTNAARFSKAEIPELPEAKKYCGEAYFHLSILDYLLANDEHQAGNTNLTNRLLMESANLAKKASEIYPELVESFYQYAKAMALLKEAQPAVQSLKTAIKADRNYSIRIDIDKDFEGIQPEISELFASLNKETSDNYKNVKDGLINSLSNHLFLTDEALKIKQKIEDYLDKAQKLYEGASYFDYLDAIDNLKIANDVLNDICPDKLIKELSGVGAVSFSPKEQLLAIGPNQASDIYLVEVPSWQTIKEKIISSWPKPTTSPLSFSPDGRYLAYNQYLHGTDPKVILLDVPSLRELAFFNQGTVNSISFSRDSKYLAVGCLLDGCVILELPSLREVKSWRSAEKYVTSVSFSPQRQYFAMANCRSVESEISIFDTVTWENLNTIKEGLHGYVDFSPNGKWLACTCDRDIIILEVSSWKKIKTIKGGFGGPLLFSPEGSYLAACADSGILLLKVPSGLEMKALQVSKHEENSIYFSSISFSLDGRYLAGVDPRYGLLFVWEKQIIKRGENCI